MFDWFDLMRQAQQSAGTAVLAKHFKLDDNQAQAAIAAFLPVFALGMQHAMATKPADAMVPNLFGGAYQNLWLNAAQAFSPRAKSNGEQILDRIFGSDETSRRVAQQAAGMAGVNTDVMRQMLPVLAGIYAGGLYHWMSGQARVMSNVAQPASAGPPAPAETWSRMCAAWAGQQEQKSSVATPFETMMAGFLPPAQQPRPDEASSNGGSPAWEDMMEKGRELQKQYLASLQSIFEEAEKTASTKAEIRP